MDKINPVEILRLGIIGLAFLLAFLAFRFLSREQRREQPRNEMLIASYVFMVFSLLMCSITVYKELKDKELGAKIQAEATVPSIDWTVQSTGSGVMIQCVAAGQKVGVPLDCRTYGTCNYKEGNRRVCAGTYYEKAIAQARSH